MGEMEKEGVMGKDTRLVVLYILDILRNKSSKNQRLQREEILGILRDEYEVACSLRSLHTYLNMLQADGYPIRIGKVGCYYEKEPQDFTDAELRMIVDGVLFSRNISQRQAKELIKRLLAKGTHSFNKRWQRLLTHCDTMPYSDNEQTLENVGIVQKAIANEKKIRYLYNTYDTELHFCPKEEKPRIFSPYQIILSQGRYYVIGNVDPHENIIPCRLDRMTEVELLDESAKPKRQIEELKTTSLSEYSAQHFYMFSGRSVQARFRAEDWMMDTLVDWFGKTFKILKQEEGYFEVLLQCNESAIKYWALQYGNSVEILAPKSLRESIADIVRGMYEAYCQEQCEQEP
ncbi:MAG: WYL domain-containing protein [Schwartzia sp.]|nr:WYL domain-containing protein [Schwartzia sp. (in: firmicutes)]